jgi:hypothetical protein
MVADGLEAIVVDDVHYWHRPGLEPAPPSTLALPGFDEYLLGYQNRAAQLSAGWFERIVPGGNGIFLPMIVVNGEIVGTWKRRATATKVVVALEQFAPLPAATSKAFDRYAQFLGLPLG